MDKKRQRDVGHLCDDIKFKISKLVERPELDDSQVLTFAMMISPFLKHTYYQRDQSTSKVCVQAAKGTLKTAIISLIPFAISWFAA